MLLAAIVVAVRVAVAHAEVRLARDDASLRRALDNLTPGDRVVVAPGQYRPGIHLRDLRGTKDAPIVIEAEDPRQPPLFVGGTTAIQLSDCDFVTLRHLAARGQTGNGFNIDDAGSLDTPSVGIVLDGLRVSDVGPVGNCDGIKLSGVHDFTVRNCTVEGWGGQAVDMVGCHRGTIEDCTFRGKPGFRQSTGPQTKGGTSRVTIRRCRFIHSAARGVNVGGSTALQFFRPPDARHEAKDITIEDCSFIGGETPVAFVGVDGAVFRHNTILRPGKWILRILQETRTEGFVPCRNVRFEHNLIVFRAADVRAHVNIGDATAPRTFSFVGNLWFCEDSPDRSRPTLPTPECDGLYGIDPRLEQTPDGALFPGEPRAASVGVRPAARTNGAEGIPNR